MIPWVKKHQPTDFNCVVGNRETVKILSNLAQHRSTPNLLICGPPGCGKTVCVDILCERLIPQNHENSNNPRMLKLSSFDERGIDNVRTTIKSFAVSKVRAEDTPCIKKIVILDEADSIGSAAFQALRNIMDTFSNTTRFIIVCNNSTNIIEPIQSRCAVLRFTRVEDEEVRSRISTICDLEKLSYTQEGVEALARVADGDVRRAINSLYSTASAFTQVTKGNVYKTCDFPQPAEIGVIVKLLGNNKNTDFLEAARVLKILCDEGYSPSDILSTFFKACCVDKTGVNIGDMKKIELAKVIGLTQTRVLAGASTYLQLAAMCDSIARVLVG